MTIYMNLYMTLWMILWMIPRMKLWKKYKSKKDKWKKDIWNKNILMKKCLGQIITIDDLMIWTDKASRIINNKYSKCMIIDAGL